jgi:hypothetical protein
MHREPCFSRVAHEPTRMLKSAPDAGPYEVLALRVLVGRMVNAATGLSPPETTHPSNIVGPRGVRIFVVAALGVASVWVMVFVHQFALSRFFTIDEYQWGHATWLIRQGKVPYRDFYEHHLPLGYLLHSAFLSDEGSFTHRALLLRKIGFAYILLAASFVGLAGFGAHRDPFKSLLSVIVPFSIGFGLMSAIDYRGDNWSALMLICCFAVLELNQRSRREWLSALAGLLFACSILMTQKCILLGGPAIALMLIPSFWQRIAVEPPPWLSRLSPLQIYHPTWFCAVALVPVALLLTLGAWLGVLGRAFQITFVQALQHEHLYPRFSAWRYVGPFLNYAPWTSAALAGFAVAYVILGRDRFWVLPTLLVLLGGMQIAAPFPYNFVLASVLIGLCAVRGYCGVVQWCMHKCRGLKTLSPLLHLLYLVPLLLVPPQLGFVKVTTTNEQQLETLREIESHSTPSDVVIDSEGSALFRPDRGYYWYQGAAHVEMFHDYYRGAFVDDLRATRAIFWIDGFRTEQLPEVAREYLRGHYIRFHGDLFVLGRSFAKNAGDHSLVSDFDVVRAGAYYLSSEGGPPDNDSAVGPAQTFWVDRQPVADGASIYLDAGQHQVSIDADAPGHRLSFLPLAPEDTTGMIGRHAPLFEYDRPR